MMSLMACRGEMQGGPPLIQSVCVCVCMSTDEQGCRAWMIMTATPLASLSVKLMAP